MFSTIRTRCGTIFSHLLRHNLFLTTIFEEQMNGHKDKGRLRKEFIEEMARQANCIRYADGKRLAMNSEEWRSRFTITKHGI